MRQLAHLVIFRQKKSLGENTAGKMWVMRMRVPPPRPTPLLPSGKFHSLESSLGAFVRAFGSVIKVLIAFI